MRERQDTVSTSPFPQGNFSASIMASATELPPDHATALQHRRQGACEDADVMLKGHKRSRPLARLSISSLGFVHWLTPCLRYAIIAPGDVPSMTCCTPG